MSDKQNNFILSKAQKLAPNICWSLVLFLTFLATYNYPGNPAVFLVFSCAFNALLYVGLQKNKFYVQAFLAIFLWLGFWLKLSIRLVLKDFNFLEATGRFDFTGQAFDKALIISTVGAVATLSCFIFVNRVIKVSYLRIETESSFRVERYLRGRRLMIFGAIASIVLVSVINLKLGIYQRGSVPETQVPGLFRHILVWLILTGFSTWTASIVYWEVRAKKSAYSGLYLAFFEAFFTNVSMLSRGFVLNTIPQLWATLLQKQSFFGNMSSKAMLRLFGIFLFSMILSVAAVGVLRAKKFEIPKKEIATAPVSTAMVVHQASTALFVDRWVGIEGVMSISSYPHVGWDLWKRAWSEKKSEVGTSFYDHEIGQSLYSKIESPKFHMITLPGIFAFLFYPGSYALLFFGIFLVISCALLLEHGAFLLTGNPILGAVFAQAIAYRLMHFGYLPQKAHLYFVAFLLNILIIALVQKFYFGASRSASASASSELSS